jgi:hypothetical protein
MRVIILRRLPLSRAETGQSHPPANSETLAAVARAFAEAGLALRRVAEGVSPFNSSTAAGGLTKGRLRQ